MKIRDFRQADFQKGLLQCLHELSGDFALSDAACISTTMKRQEKGVRTFVAISNKQTVYGTASVFVYPTYLHGGALAGHIEDVAVHPDRRGVGIGRVLVEHCVAYCREKKCYKVVLNCSPENRAFYEKCGFKKMADDFMRIDL